MGKVKIVVDNMTAKALNAKYGLQTCSFEVNKGHHPENELYYHPSFHPICPSNGYGYPAYHYYEHGQTNQNHQAACEAKNGDSGDESMWRPW